MTISQTLMGSIALSFFGATALLYGHAAGPDPRHTGAPGDDPKACATTGCHVGTALNGGGGQVTIAFPNGSTYTPGVQQTLTVMVSDPKARVYGFQASARLSSDPANGQAGDFTSGSGQLVLCDDGSLKGSAGCSANASVEFIEHSVPSTTGVWKILWTAPSTNVGNIMIYVAGNGANGDGQDTGDHIYTASYTLTPASGGGNKPSIVPGAIVSASAFNAQAGVAPGTWLEIFGSDISSVTGEWGGGDFKNNVAPTSLSGVSVTVDGKSAFVRFTAPGQVNVQVPDSNVTGPVQVVVTNSSGSSDPIAVQQQAIAPALLAPSAFKVGGTQYVVAQFADNTYVGKTGSISGVNSKPAKAGDTIILYGIGFGPVTPSIPAGTIATQNNSLVTKPNFRFGQTLANLTYYGLSPGFVGLYQFNVQVPNVGSGDVGLSVDVNGVSTNQQLFITLQ